VKNLLVFVVLAMPLILDTTSWAQSDRPEVLTLSAFFGISDCDVSSKDCAVPFGGDNISISLDKCSSSASDTQCIGSWSQQEVRDGIPWSATITVTKDKFGNSTRPLYYLTANAGSTADGLPQTSIKVALSRKGTLTNSLTLTGAAILSRDGKTSYAPILTIGPGAAMATDLTPIQ
jgi:hypothetical protein